MARAETILFTIDKDNNCRIGLPPLASEDNYNKRAMVLGKLENVTRVFFSPTGHMFVVRGDELYRGPTASSPWSDWFSLAKCVGRGGWDEYKFLYFNPGGDLFAVTEAGAWFTGPEPDNPHVPWLYRKAWKIGGSGWNPFEALFFDPNNVMYGVYENRLLKGNPLSTTDGNWLGSSISLGDGWSKMTYFMGFSSNGNLWCINKDDGKMYTASPPPNKQDKWITRARNMGGDYRMYKHLSFSHDKTIKKILDLAFLTDIGKVLSTEPELVTEKSYDNKNSTTPLNSTFEVNKMYIVESQFTHEHGFECGVEAETTFEAGIPIVSKGSIRLTSTVTTAHNWNFTQINRTETHFKLTSEFEVEPGKAIRQIAIAKKATMNVPYSATIITVFGNKTVICGTWKGACYFDLRVKQSDQ